VVWGNNHFKRQGYDHFAGEGMLGRIDSRTGGQRQETASQGWGTQPTRYPALRGRLQSAKRRD